MMTCILWIGVVLCGEWIDFLSSKGPTKWMALTIYTVELRMNHFTTVDFCNSLCGCGGSVPLPFFLRAFLTGCKIDPQSLLTLVQCNWQEKC